MVDLDRESLESTFIPALANWSYHVIFEYIAFVVERTPSSEGGRVDEWSERLVAVPVVLRV